MSYADKVIDADMKKFAYGGNNAEHEQDSYRRKLSLDLY